MSNHEERIRELAYQMWEADGKPTGRATIYWHAAAKVIDEANKTGQRSPKKSVDPSEAKGATEPEQPDQT